MSFKPLFIAILVLSTSGVIAQVPILEATTYKKGIYKTFEEFQNNAPSLPLNYEFKTVQKSYGAFGAGGKVFFKRLIVKRKEGKAVGEVFGF